MKEVDQRTGADLNPQEAPLNDDAVMSTDDRAPWMNPEREEANKKGPKQAVADSGKSFTISFPHRFVTLCLNPGFSS